MHMESVEHELDCWMVDGIEQLNCLLCGAKHVAFEAVERFHGQHDAKSGRMLTRLLQAGDAAGLTGQSFLLVYWLRWSAGKDERVAGQRTADNFSAKSDGTIGRVFEIVYTGTVRGRIIRRQVALQVDAGRKHYAEFGSVKRSSRLV